MSGYIHIKSELNNKFKYKSSQKSSIYSLKLETILENKSIFILELSNISKISIVQWKV